MKLLSLPAIALGIVAAFSFAKASENVLPVSAEGEANEITLSCPQKVRQGGSCSGQIKLTAYEQVKTLSLQIHFDSEVLSVNSLSAESGAASLYDSSIAIDTVSYTCIFDTLQLQQPTLLFTFSYMVELEAQPGSHFFDVVISEAYDASMNPIDVCASRASFEVQAKESQKMAHFYATQASVGTSAGRTFSLDYHIWSEFPASGVFALRYDDELFDFVSLDTGSFFADSMVDYNASGKGEVLVSFLRYSNSIDGDLFTVSFETKKNIAASSEITLVANELYDDDLLPLGHDSFATTVNVNYDPFFDELPSLYSTCRLDSENKQVVLTL